MRKLIPILFTPFLFAHVNGQTYQKAHDLGADDYGNNIMLLNANLMVVGSSTSNTSGTFCVAVMNADLDGTMNDGGGQVGGPGTEFGRDLYASENGDVTILGRSNSFSTDPANVNDFMAVRLGDGGAPQWMTVFGSDSVDLAIAMTEANDGGVVFVGQSKRRHLQRIDAVAVKLNAATGAIEWSKEIGFEHINETAFSVRALGTDDGYLVLGYSGANVIGLNEAMVVLLDDNGDKDFAFLFGTAGDDDARVMLDGGASGDGFYIAGNTRNIGQGSGECFLASFSFENNAIVMDWFKTYGSAANESLQSAFKDDNGDILLVGTTPVSGSGQEGFLVKVNPVGEILWSNLYGGPDNDFLQNVISDGEGGYIAVGYSNSFGENGNDVWLVRVDADGNSACNQVDAEFVGETIDPSVAYMITSHEQLDNITSTDVSYTVRNSSTLAFYEHVPSENTLCMVVSLEDDLSNNDSYNVFPNPSESGVFNVSLGAGSYALTAMDAMGREVLNVSAQQGGQAVLDLSGLPKGLYLVSVTDMASGEHSLLKLIR